jgi:hypothetical protein
VNSRILQRGACHHAFDSNEAPDAHSPHRGLFLSASVDALPANRVAPIALPCNDHADDNRGVFPMRKLTLTLAAIYLGAIGLALLLVPLQFGIGAVPADASPQLMAFLRLMGGPFLGIAMLNWLARGAEPSSLLQAILLANLIGFGVVAANDVWSVANGEAREVAKYFQVIHLLFALAFAALARAEWRSGAANSRDANAPTAD